jgi:hypothetical protein
MKTFKQFLNEENSINVWANSKNYHHFWKLQDLEIHKNKKIYEEFGGSYTKPVKTIRYPELEQFVPSQATLQKPHLNSIVEYKEESPNINGYLRERKGVLPGPNEKITKLSSEDDGPESDMTKLNMFGNKQVTKADYIRHHVTNLDHVTNNTLTKPLVVYRGVYNKSTDPKKLDIGSTFTDHGYVSTSLRPDIAAQDVFSYYGKTPNSKGKIPHVFYIHLSPGDKGNFTDHPNILNKAFGIDREDRQPLAAQLNDPEHQNEVLLPRGTTYQVLGHEHVEGVAPSPDSEDKYNSMHVIHIKPIAYREE